MKTFVQHLTERAVETALNSAETNLYANAKQVYEELPEQYKSALELVFKADQSRSKMLGLTIQTEKKTKKGAQFARIIKKSKITANVLDYAESVKRNGNEEFQAQAPSWGESLSKSIVWNNGQFYIYCHPTYTKNKYYVDTQNGNLQEIDYEFEQTLLPPSQTDEYRREHAQEHQGVEDVVKCIKPKLVNVSSVKYGDKVELFDLEW